MAGDAAPRPRSYNTSTTLGALGKGRMWRTVTALLRCHNMHGLGVGGESFRAWAGLRRAPP